MKYYSYNRRFSTPYRRQVLEVTVGSSPADGGKNKVTYRFHEICESNRLKGGILFSVFFPLSVYAL